MTTPAVQAEQVWKQFQRGEQHDSLRDLIPAAVRRLRGGAPTDRPLGEHDFWAVQDVNFDVQFGQALGIIGPNGAGKSTMLKLLTGILRPTKGEIRMRGRVASLIEVAAGFHQDLTGRENIYLQGAILGMARRDIARRLESIVEFSGIAPFIDTPVKRYSSGMNARLGFSIAVHLEPDVLVIDEVLSVGDLAFQQKCVDRMRAFKRDGVAIVFVSHNMQSIGELCDEAVVLKSSVRFRGRVGDAVGEYLRITSGSETGDGRGRGLRLTRAALTDAAGQPLDATAPGATAQLHVDLAVEDALPENVQYCMLIRRATDGFTVYDGAFTGTELGIGAVRPGEAVRLRFDHQLHLRRGQYTYEFNVVQDDIHGSGQAHRLWVAPISGVRIDEFRTYGGVADLGVQARGAREGGAMLTAAAA